jgi:N-acetylglucosamine kinase-like BadF-type ATPase
MGLVLGVDGGNSKTDVVLASTEGEPLAYVRGAGSNAHSRGLYEGAIDIVSATIEQLPLDGAVDRAVLFMCGADLPDDIRGLGDAVAARGWAREAVVDNDTFALLHAGTDADDAVAVVCGSGINCVGRGGDRVARYPGLGWETGDWGGAEALGQEAIYHACRAADGRGEPTALLALVESHFGKPAAEVGADFHYKRLPRTRLGELAPRLVELADDPIALELTQRLADEIVLLVERALRDLELDRADIVLGGSVLTSRGRVYELVAEQLPSEPIVSDLPPVAGSVLAALDHDAQHRFREAFKGWAPHAG